MASTQTFDEAMAVDPRAEEIRNMGRLVLSVMGADPADEVSGDPGPEAGALRYTEGRRAARIAAAGQEANDLATRCRLLIAKQPSLSPTRAWDRLRAEVYGLPEEFDR